MVSLVFCLGVRLTLHGEPIPKDPESWASLVRNSSDFHCACLLPWENQIELCDEDEIAR